MIPSYGARIYFQLSFPRFLYSNLFIAKRVNKIDNILAANFFVDREGFWHSYSVWRPKDKPKACTLSSLHR